MKNWENLFIYSDNLFHVAYVKQNFFLKFWKEK